MYIVFKGLSTDKLKDKIQELKSIPYIRYTTCYEISKSNYNIKLLDMCDEFIINASELLNFVVDYEDLFFDFIEKDKILYIYLDTELSDDLKDMLYLAKEYSMNYILFSDEEPIIRDFNGKIFYKYSLDTLGIKTDTECLTGRDIAIVVDVEEDTDIKLTIKNKILEYDYSNTDIFNKKIYTAPILIKLNKVTKETIVDTEYAIFKIIGYTDYDNFEKLSKYKDLVEILYYNDYIPFSTLYDVVNKYVVSKE